MANIPYLSFLTNQENNNKNPTVSAEARNSALLSVMLSYMAAILKAFFGGGGG